MEKAYYLPANPVSGSDSRCLRILHCFRAPVGGLFRHICDLTFAQVERGHKVGLIFSDATDLTNSNDQFARLRKKCELGIHRLHIKRGPGPTDIWGIIKTGIVSRNCNVDIIHGHGAKGGVYARIAALMLKCTNFNPRIFYTPHGGTLHYDKNSINGYIYFLIESLLQKVTDGLIFECAYSKQNYVQKVAEPVCRHKIIYNGLYSHEFNKVNPEKTASDFLFVGELRHIKGIDVFIKALSLLNESGPATASIIGSGPKETELREMVTKHQLNQQIRFLPPAPVRQAFEKGHCLVVPSRKEAFPYIVLEAAASNKPMILSKVGGIPEIVGSTKEILVKSDDPRDLAIKLKQFLNERQIFECYSTQINNYVRNSFRLDQMTNSIIDLYRD